MTSSERNIFPAEYHIIKKIGSGGTADVFLAQRQACALPVALKLFFDDQAAHLIEREIDVSREIKFPGFVRIRRKGKCNDGRHFLETEYCPGEKLDSLAGAIDEKNILSILSALSCDLYVLHQAGFVHNDLKPNNIFLPVNRNNQDFSSGSLFYLKLNDFSLARRCEDRETCVTGTIGYMSPEMILKETISPASDLFSLGVLAYQLACGRSPFFSEANDPLEINAQITQGKRPEICGSKTAFSDELKGIIHALLEVEPHRRPSSAFVLTEHLARAGSPYPFRRAVRPRHLLAGRTEFSPETMIEIFGEDSFSEAQMDFIGDAIGFESRNLRLLLEYNFSAGNFARLDGKWGWKNDTARVIQWPHAMSKFNVRLIKGKPVSFKLTAMALAVVGDDADLKNVACRFSNESDRITEMWRAVPDLCRVPLLFSLDQAMDDKTRMIISRRLIPLYLNDDKRRSLLGRLYFYAGHYQNAIRNLIKASEQGIQESYPDDAFRDLELAFESATRVSDLSAQADIALRQARVLKDLGRTQAAEEQYLRALDLIEKTDKKDLLALAYKEIGDIYKAKSDYSAGIEALKKAQIIYQDLGDQLELSHTLNNLGNIYWVAGELDKALDCYQQAVKIQVELKSDKDIASSLSNIGSIHLVRGQYKKGISYLRKSLTIKERLGDRGELARTYNNIGVAHFLGGDMAQAIEAYIKSLDLNRQIGDRHEQLLNIENLAEAMTQAGRLKQALEYLKEGVKLAEMEGSEFHRGDLTRLTGQLLRRIGSYRDAEVKSKEALDLSRRIDNKGLQMVCAMGMARLYLIFREYDAAMEYMKQAHSIARSLGDKSGLFYLALMKMEVSGDEKHRQTAEQLAQELDSARETAQLNIALLERNNRERITEGSRVCLERAAEFFVDQHEDIDCARFGLAAGQYYFLKQELDTAASKLEKAFEDAVSKALLPEQWQIMAVLSEVALARKEFETSFQCAQKTISILKTISAQFDDKERLGRLYNDQRVVDILGRLKSLHSVLGNKKGAAVSNP